MRWEGQIPSKVAAEGFARLAGPECGSGAKPSSGGARDVAASSLLAGCLGASPSSGCKGGFTRLGRSQVWLRRLAQQSYAGKQLGGPYPRTGVCQTKKVGWESESCWLGRDIVGSGPVLSVWAPSNKTVSDQKKVEKQVDFFIFCCGSNEPISVEKRAILAPGAPYRGRAH